MSTAFTIKVFFRGDWCPWCNAYLRDFNDHIQDIKDLGGDVIGITSQAGNQSAANNNLKYRVLVDEGNAEAAKYGMHISPKAETPLADVDGAYPNGMVQPGVVIESDAGDVLYRWAIVPSEMNLGGASDRPLVSDITASLHRILAQETELPLFAKTDLDYLRDAHPESHDRVQAYLASLT